MREYKRLTKHVNGKLVLTKDKASYSEIYYESLRIKEALQRLADLEDKIERGELVFTEEEQYKKRQWIKSAARVMCCCRCDAENCNYQCSYKDDAERLYEARGCRI